MILLGSHLAFLKKIIFQIFNTSGNVLKNYYNNPNIKMIKDEKIIIDSYTNQSTSNSKNKIKKKSIDRSISGKECFNKVKINKKRFPEDYYDTKRKKIRKRY